MKNSFILITVFICFHTLFTGFTPPVCNCKVYIPNIFSPNAKGDPDNQTLRPFFPADCLFTDYEFTVYDRWGKLVFKSDSPDQAWDGTFNGQPMGANVYVYLLKIHFEDTTAQKPEIITGDVALVR